MVIDLLEEICGGQKEDRKKKHVHRREMGQIFSLERWKFLCRIFVGDQAGHGCDQRTDTQMTYGFSRDDVGRILETYFDKKILESDPFARLDQNGVGRLIRFAVAEGKRTRPDIKLGICGEHGGDLSSVEFCHNVGLNYVSCSPFRVPIARLAAAQARVKELGLA